MNSELIPAKIEKLESTFLNILYMKPEDRIVAPTMNSLNDLKDVLNSIFDENTCMNVIYTINTDKQFFGIRINPFMNASDAAIILTSDEKVKLNKYQIEFDSKLFEIGLSESELAAVTIFEVSSMMDSYDIFDRIRAIIDTGILNNEVVINIRDSVNAAQLMIFAIKDTMYKLSSLCFKENPDDLLANPAVAAASLEDYIVTAREKIVSSVSGLGGDSFRSANVSILHWMLVMYRNVKENVRIISDTLKDAIDFSGSKLEIDEINKTIDAIDRIDNYMIETSDINKFFDMKNMSTVNEASLFKNLKKNGLRSIENELYEYTMKVKNCTESEDAYMIMRGINSRLGILEDYLINETEMNQHERNHWEYVAQQYRDLRVKLSGKKFKEKQYGLFFDYSALDQLDANRNNNNGF